MRDRAARESVVTLMDALDCVITACHFQQDQINALVVRVRSLEDMVAAMAADAITGEG